MNRSASTATPPEAPTRGPLLIGERDPRGRKPTCLCGTCKKCKHREYKRNYHRDYYHGIRRPGTHAVVWTPENDALLGTKPDTTLAEELGLSRSAVQHRRYKLGIPRHHVIRKRTEKGYVLTTLLPTDPLVEMSNSNRVVQEHRVVMARHLGRPLTRDEKVHHRNGIKDDNRIENLELWTGSHPAGQRVEDVFEWCVEFIERYADELHQNNRFYRET